MHHRSRLHSQQLGVGSVPESLGLRVLLSEFHPGLEGFPPVFLHRPDSDRAERQFGEIGQFEFEGNIQNASNLEWTFALELSTMQRKIDSDRPKPRQLLRQTPYADRNSLTSSSEFSNIGTGGGVQDGDQILSFLRTTHDVADDEEGAVWELPCGIDDNLHFQTLNRLSNEGLNGNL